MASIGAQTALRHHPVGADPVRAATRRDAGLRGLHVSLGVTGGIAGRFSFSLLSEIIGRRRSGLVLGFGGALCIAAAGLGHNVMLGGVSLFWLMIICADFFFDGGFAVIGPYMAEVWPTRLRTTGMGSAYGFGGFGKIIGPLGLALMIGASDVITPKATIDAIVPGFLYFAAWMALCGCAFLFFGFETGRQSLVEIDAALDEAPAADGVRQTGD